MGTLKKKRAKKTKADSDSEDEEVVVVEGGGSTRSDTIPWSDNPAWLAAGVDYLTDNPAFRLKLFSDSTEDAKAEGRGKKQSKESKIGMYGLLCDHIFAGPEVMEGENEQDVDDSECVADTGWRKRYKEEEGRFAKSLQQQFARLKPKYSKAVKKLYATGGGLKPEDVQANLIEKLREDFPHWDELDSFWRELPNYNPIGVNNSASGTNHAARAGSLFAKGASEAEDTDHGPQAFARSSSVSLAGGDDYEDEEKEKKGKTPKPTNTAVVPKTEKDKDRAKSNKNPKAGDKRAFDLSSLDELYSSRHHFPTTAFGGN